MRTPVEGDRLILIAECDASAAGFACGEREPHTRDGVLLNNLHVLPSHHGRGLGKLMVDAIEDWARKLGETQLYLHVVEENRQAIAFYERQGWRFSGAESHHIAGTPVTALRYVRPIV